MSCRLPPRSLLIAFRGTSLTSVVFPNTLTRIGQRVFYECSPSICLHNYWMRYSYSLFYICSTSILNLFSTSFSYNSSSLLFRILLQHHKGQMTHPCIQLHTSRLCE